MLSSSASFSFKPCIGEIAHDEAERGLLQRAGDADRMQKALLAFGGFGRAVSLGRRSTMAAAILIACSILPLAKPGWVLTPSMVMDGAIGGESLVLDIARGFAVDGVGEVGAELFQVGLVDTAADLFVGREQDLDGAVLDLRVVDQELRGIHDFGKAGLVVGAEQGGAVGRDDVVADLVGQCRDVPRRG